MPTASGLAAMFSFPSHDETHRLGALDLYRETSGPMDTEAMETARTPADVTTTHLLDAESRAELEASSQQAEHNSLHDALTGLPDRTLFIQRLYRAPLQARRSKKLVAASTTSPVDTRQTSLVALLDGLMPNTDSAM